ncbi:CinA family protein [Helicobacter jaachi]|nr:CinA family protein [Helicobacter jaachi]
MKPNEMKSSDMERDIAQGMILHTQLAQAALEIMHTRGLYIAMAESCTGGLLSYHFTALSGASQVFLGSMVSYANEIKHKWLNVKEADLQAYGAVSEPVVRAMCEGVLRESGADIALATSGIAGPSGGSAKKPVGSVYIGVQSRGSKMQEGKTIVSYNHFSGDRQSVQLQSCAKALEMLLTLLNS